MEAAQVLLAYGADTKVWDNGGLTPLLSALASGQLDVARMLLEHGTDLEARTPSGCTPLYFADEEIARFLIERGADAKALNENGQTPFVTGPWDERAYACSCTEISSGTGHGLLTDDCLLLLSG